MPHRILIADDNPTFRGALRLLLEGVDGWEIIEAQDGQDAVNTAVKTRPDLILLDLAMPEKDGFTAAREISQLLPATPILMCTMHMSGQVAIEAQKSGIKQVLSKSDSHLLVAAIRQLLNPEPTQSDHALPPETSPLTVPVPPVTETLEPSSAVETTTDPVPSAPKNVA